MSSIADYLFKKEEVKRQKQQDFFNNILNAVKTGTDVWTALQESGKYNPGSSYMKAQELISKTWPEENAAFQAAQEKGLYDYKRQNPEKPAQQVANEWLMSEPGQAFLKMGYTREDAVRAAEQANAMARIDASQGGKGMQDSTWEAYKQGLGGAQDAFLMRDEMGNSVWKPGVNKEQVRQFLYRFVAMADSRDQDKLRQLFDAWVDFPTMSGPPTTLGAKTPAIDLGPIMKTIQEILAASRNANPNIDLTPPPNKQNPTMGEPPATIWPFGSMGLTGAGQPYGTASNLAAREQDKMENAAADQLANLKNRGITQEERSVIEWAIPELRKPGPSEQWEKIAAIVKALSAKYKALGAPTEVPKGSGLY